MSIEQHILTTAAYLQKADHSNNNLDAEHTFYNLAAAYVQISAALKISHKKWCQEYSAKHPAEKA